MFSPDRSHRRAGAPAASPSRSIALTMALAIAVMVPLLPAAVGSRVAGIGPDHLVVSEVVTGGASASDELIEVHNPTDAALPLEGLEVIYVTASGATISRRAAWAVGAPSVPARGHLLIANEAGVYAGIADALYASGMAATGGSVAIRIQGASSAIDAVGWGTSTSTWREGTPVAAPAAGESVERLPGGQAGSGQDSDDNLADFAARPLPEPQNLLSPPTPDPGATPAPSPTPTPSAAPTPTAPPSATPAPTATPGPTATPTPDPSPSPGPEVLTVAVARSAPDGTTVTIEGVALAGSAFHDGGGYVADASGGIAVLPMEASFERGALLRVTGEVDDRFSQRTVRTDAGGITLLGTAAEPEPVQLGTAQLGEATEGSLARLTGAVAGSPTQLTAGLAFDLDDGSGPARVIVNDTTGIATDAWEVGATVTMRGIVGQRDSTGSGTEGYRLLPRDPADVFAIQPPSSPTPSPSSSVEPSPSASPGDPGVVSIADARSAPVNARLTVRGVVTLPTGLVDERTAVIQDGSGAIALRLGGDAGSLGLGQHVEVSGTRSTLSGMETLRITKPARALGTGSEPEAVQLATGEAGESLEARLVTARGAVVASARRSSSGTVSFEIDDGSGPLRVSAGAALDIDRDALPAGAWVEVRGVLGQDTPRSRPDEGYRIWPRSAAEIRVVAPATGATGGSSDREGGGSAGGPALGTLDAADLSRLRVGATLVVGRWPELGVAGLLWDGTRLVAVDASSSRVVARLTAGRRPPVAVELGGLQLTGRTAIGGATIVRLGTAEGDATVLDAVPAPPRGTLAGARPAWVTVVGRLTGSNGRPSLLVAGETIRIHRRCSEAPSRVAAGATVAVTGIALDTPPRLVVPCDGIHPAPALALARTRASAPRPTSSAGEVETTATDVGDPRRAAASGLLVAAALALAAAAWLRRRIGPGSSVGEGPVEGASEAAQPARLTLVPVRDEGGS